MDSSAQAFIVTNLILNSLGALCASMLALLIVAGRYYQPKLLDRISIRFTLAVAIVDLIKAAILVMYTVIHFQGIFCVVVSFLIQWVSLLYFTLHVALAFNLQMVFLSERPFNPFWERIYWGIALILPTILTVLPLMADRLGYDESSESCEYRDAYSLETYYWLWSTHLTWNILGSVYCSLIASISLVKLLFFKNIICNLKPCGQSCIQDFDAHERYNARKTARGLVLRTIIISFIPILTQIWYPILRAYEYETHDIPPFLNWLSVLGSDIPGILNCALFLTDPKLLNIVRYARAKNQNKKNENRDSDIQTKSSSSKLIQTSTCHRLNLLNLEHRSQSNSVPFLAGTNIPLSQFVKGI